MKLISRTTLLIVFNAVVLLGCGLVSYVIISHQVDASIPPPKSGKTVQSAAPGVASIEDDTILSKPIFRRSRQAIGFDTTRSADSEAKPPPLPPPAPPRPGRGAAGNGRAKLGVARRWWGSNPEIVDPRWRF